MRQMSSNAQTLTYPVDQDYPILQHALQRPVKVGKHDGLGSGLNAKTLRVPDDVDWNEIHTWSAPDPFLDGVADSERYKKTVHQRDSPYWSIPATAWKPDTTTAVAAADQAIVKGASYSQPHPQLCIQELSRCIYSLLSDNPRRTISDFRRVVGLFVRACRYPKNFQRMIVSLCHIEVNHATTSALHTLVAGMLSASSMLRLLVNLS
jgi:hypothetical protein